MDGAIAAVVCLAQYSLSVSPLSPNAFNVAVVLCHFFVDLEPDQRVLIPRFAHGVYDVLGFSEMHSKMPEPPSLDTVDEPTIAPFR